MIWLGVRDMEVSKFMSKSQTPPPNPSEQEGSKFAGKVIVALVPFVMVLTYFGMHTMGQLFQPGVAVPFIVTSVITIGAVMGFVWFLARSENDPARQKMVTAFFMTALLVMAIVVFKLNGLF